MSIGSFLMVNVSLVLCHGCSVLVGVCVVGVILDQGNIMHTFKHYFDKLQYVFLLNFGLIITHYITIYIYHNAVIFYNSLIKARSFLWAVRRCTIKGTFASQWLF